MPRKEPSDFKSKLAKASLPERSILLCLNGALRGEYDQLEVELVGMTNDGTSRLGGNPHAADLARRMQALRAEMADSEVMVRLRGMRNTRWMELLTEHAPRKGDKGDESLGFNQSTFYDALIRESLVDPVLDDDDFESLLDALNSRQFDELANTAWSLNRGDVRVPFSALASETLRNSGETSKPQPDSGSPLAGSGDGNHNGQPSTATAQSSPAG